MIDPHTYADCDAFHDLVRDFGGDVPTIVCLCGSTRFGEAFRDENLRLTLAGKIVLSIGCDMRSDAEIFGDATEDELARIKADLDALHKRKIDLCDEVLVLNVASPEHPHGYIDDSTRSEIDYAEKIGRPVRYLVDPSGNAADSDCRRCKHSSDDHDAGECWAHVNGDQCSCSWYEPAVEVSR